MNTLLNIIKSIQLFLIEIGELSYFTIRFFKEAFKPPFEFNELLRQCFNIGNRSLFLVATTGFIIGLVFTLQSRPTLEQFGAASWIPAMVSVSIIREIGPIITALICAGRIGSGIGAEIGSMRVTEQIDAMEVSGTNPFKYLVVTRVLAATLMLPILVFFQCCSQANNSKAEKQNSDSTRYYTVDDFKSVEKIDAHVHINAEADTVFIKQAEEDNFRLLTINVYKEGGTPIEEQQKFSIKTVKAFYVRHAK